MKTIFLKILHPQIENFVALVISWVGYPSCLEGELGGLGVEFLKSDCSSMNYKSYIFIKCQTNKITFFAPKVQILVHNVPLGVYSMVFQGVIWGG
jgi:hypothetical protein